MEDLLRNQRLLMGHINAKLLKQASGVRVPAGGGEDNKSAAAVLFLLGMHRTDPARPPEACLILNQRSRHVRQPGDLCFPGGGLAPHLDRFLAGLLRLPGFPLFPWPLGRSRPPMPRGMSRLLATSLRESFEEMRLNPLGVRFLGPMAPEYFRRFGRTIYPMVAWTCGQKHFSPNWEVDRIVYIPLGRFLRPEAYGRLPATHLSQGKEQADAASMTEVPCLTYENGGTRELLWGLTYRIVMRFLYIVFDFSPPETTSLPEIPTQWRE